VLSSKNGIQWIPFNSGVVNDLNSESPSHAKPRWAGPVFLCFAIVLSASIGLIFAGYPNENKCLSQRWDYLAGLGYIKLPTADFSVFPR